MAIVETTFTLATQYISVPNLYIHLITRYRAVFPCVSGLLFKSAAFISICV